MNIVVTGGVGFIGSHLCETLLKEGHKVICIDNFDEFYQLNIKIRNLFESTGNKKQFKIFEKEILSKNLSKNEIINSIKEFIKNDNYKLYFMDIRDKEIEKIFREEKPDIVINLAGLAGVRPSLLNPLEYESVNVQGFINLLENCKRCGINKFIQASSSSASACILLSGDHERSGRVIFLRQLLRPGIGGVDDRIVKNLLSHPRGLADTF